VKGWPRLIVPARISTAEECSPISITFLRALEEGELRLVSVDGSSFFAQVVKDVQMGFFADPIYGGKTPLIAMDALSSTLFSRTRIVTLHDGV
jgi:hypothetical protein